MLKFLLKQRRKIGVIKMNKYLDIAPEVGEALENRRAVVALETTVLSHGLPYPDNVKILKNIENTVRENGAVPAAMAVIGGRLKCGLTEEEIEYLGRKKDELIKCSRRDIPAVISRKLDGVTTAAATMIIANLAGVRIFATSGIGGVHRGAEITMDISADLEELARTPILVVCTGVKAILDPGMTLEYLETKGVPVIGYGTDEFPAFFTKQRGFRVDYRMDTLKELAETFDAQRKCGLYNGMLVTNPIPEEISLDHAAVDQAVDRAVEEARQAGIHGKEITPFLLERINRVTGGKSLDISVKLIYNNGKVAAQIASQLCKL